MQRRKAEQKRGETAYDAAEQGMGKNRIKDPASVQRLRGQEIEEVQRERGNGAAAAVFPRNKETKRAQKPRKRPRRGAEYVIPPGWTPKRIEPQPGNIQSNAPYAPAAQPYRREMPAFVKQYTWQCGGKPSAAVQIVQQRKENCRAGSDPHAAVFHSTAR